MAELAEEQPEGTQAGEYEYQGLGEDSQDDEATLEEEEVGLVFAVGCRRRLLC